jgi:hypothetical protein
MLFSVDENMNISMARGYPVDIPVQVRRASGADYTMIPGDTLMFTVKNAPGAQTTLIQKVVSEPVIPLVPADTTALNYGTYFYDLVLIGGGGWTETILGPCSFYLGGDDNELLDGYRRLLTSEYKTRPRLTSWLLWLLSEGLTYKNTVQEFLDAFNLDTAEGVQLDIIGRIVGVDRLLSFHPVSGDSPLMNDSTYRMVIKAKIIQNTWKGTLDELYEAWAVLFPEVRYFQIQDLQDMTYNVVIMGAFTPLERELIANGYIIPKPEGVRINLLTITDTSGLPLFAYDMDTYLLSGYTSHWAEPE